MTKFEPEVAFEQLKNHQDPYLIGVRHHSVALARVIPELLDNIQPEKILLELPGEFQDWIQWLGHPETKAPIALSAVNSKHQTVFYPFADFSPELATIRWANKNNVEVIACDLPVAQASESEEEIQESPKKLGLVDKLYHITHTPDHQSLWDKLVESKAVDASPEDIRTSALLFGWTLRMDTLDVSVDNLKREKCMRMHIKKWQHKKCAIVAGAFHIPAFLDVDKFEDKSENNDQKELPDINCSLIPYGFSHFDERSGYPAGIKDPHWQQGAWESKNSKEQETFAANCIIEICRDMRGNGFQASSAEAIEAMRFCKDLAILRGISVSGRQELLESLQTILVKGEPMGQGRSVARSMEHILIGNKRGVLPKECPQLGLAHDLRNILAKLKMPDENQVLKEPKEYRLDPLRSPIDRARCVLLNRLNRLMLTYGEKKASELSDTLTEVWHVKWNEQCSAMVAHAATFGSTVEQAVTGYLTSEYLNFQKTEKCMPATRIESIVAAASAGLPNLVASWLEDLFTSENLSVFSMDDNVSMLNFIERVLHQHEPGLPETYDDKYGIVFSFKMPRSVSQQQILQNALFLMEGFIESSEFEDAMSLRELWHWIGRQDNLPGLSKWNWLLNQMLADGSCLMKGVALILLTLAEKYEDPGVMIGSWIDAATTPETRSFLKQYLCGVLIATGELISSDSDIVSSITERLNLYSDQDFLSRLPAMRGSFDLISPAARGRILQDIIITIDKDARRDVVLNLEPEILGLLAQSDLEGHEEVLKDFDGIMLNGKEGCLESRDENSFDINNDKQKQNSISIIARWKLILGQKLKEDGPSSMAKRVSVMLDDLYGNGTGEGSGKNDSGGGSEAPSLSAREWSEEIDQLWESEVRDEIKVEAALHGRHAALLDLTPEKIVPSVELLESILSIQGSLSEEKLIKLRKLVDHILKELIKALSTSMKPAMRGLMNFTPRTRPTPRLHLRKTIEANLKTCRKVDGDWKLLPEKIYFKSHMQNQIDWHLILVVDVSASMEASVIHSAIMASIFSSLPTVSVKFLAFSTEVIDFSDRVDDPLSLLLEINVGGGTDIGKGLNAARSALKVPARSLVVLISDFEEGSSIASLLNEVSLLHTSGATLLGVASLDAAGKPRYHKGIAGEVAAAGMPVAAISPKELARWVRDKIR